MPSFRCLLPVFLSLGSLLRATDASLEVKVVKPHHGEIIRFVSLPGTLVANQQATLQAKIGGFLKSISVDKGDSVKAGQLIAELEVPELQADRAHDQAQLNLAKVEAGRMDAALTKAPDLVTPDAVDEAGGKLKLAEADLARTETLLGYTTIRAPFSGIVTMRYVDPGAFIPAATVSTNATAAALVTLMDFSTVRTQVEVPEVEASFVSVGEPVRVSVTSLPTRVFTGKISRFTYAIDQATRTLLVEADLPNPELVLRPGMYATVEVGVEKHPNALLVPATAVVREKANAFVFTVANGAVGRVPIKLGFADTGNVEITGGLDPGALVVLNGKLPLVAGQAVKAVESP